MSHIVIHRPHNLDRGQAREAAESIAVQLEDKFNLAYRWEGDSLYFKRSGVKGHLDLEASAVSITVRLGLLMFPMKPHFEREIHRYMDEVFASA